MRVYIRHIDYDNLQLAEGVRLFVAEAPSGADAVANCAAPKTVCGFVLVDPMFRDGAVYGYVTSVNRMLRGSHPGGRLGNRGRVAGAGRD
jgi:hypothetical protein